MTETRAKQSARDARARGREPSPAAAADRRQRVAPTAPAVPLLSDLPGEEMTPQVRSAVMKLMDELDRLKDELTAANERVSQLLDVADEDPLVPVLNRRGFERELERILAYAKRYGTTVALVYLDLDDFKGVNDRYGHSGGDAALKHFAAILLENVRRSDLVGRLGGDEFALVLHHADEEAARLKGEQIAAQMSSSPVLHGGGKIRLGMTFGATALREGDTLRSVLERADKAMYEGKTARRAARARQAGG